MRKLSTDSGTVFTIFVIVSISFGPIKNTKTNITNINIKNVSNRLSGLFSLGNFLSKKFIGMLRINAIAAPTKNGSTIESIFVKIPNISPIRYKIKTRNIKNIIPSNIFLICFSCTIVPPNM